MSDRFRLLENKIALVTGAGSGIGEAIAKGFARHGATLVLAGRRLSPLEETAGAVRDAGGQAHVFELDISDKENCAAVARQVSSSVGDISILVNNAGVIRYAKIDDPQVYQAWDEQLTINLSGPFNVTMAFLPALRATRASVINLGSIAASVYVPVTPGYSAAKAGVHMLTAALARELGPDGVRVNTLAPGVIATRMSASAGDRKKLEALHRRVALQRIGTGDDLVGPAVFLASDMSAYVTGTTLGVDGGYLTY